MKKTLITTAVAAGLLAAGAAQADDPTVYGNVHLSLNKLSDKIYDAGSVAASDQLDMTSNTSAIGIKGSEDLGDGMKAIYKLEFQVGVDERNKGDAASSLTDRDQWVGLKGGFGKVAFGTMSSNYKQMGGKIDPLYRTVAEGRGVLNLQSGLHGGAGEDGGRMTNAVQYTSPKMGGVSLVLNTTFSNKDGQQTATLSNDETMGLGIRYKTKNILAYFDYLDPNAGSAGAYGCTGACTGKDESVMEIGGKYSADNFSVAGQYEMTEDQLGGDYIFLAGTFNIDSNNVVALTWGQQDKISSGYAIAYVHVLSKMTNVYAGYGAVDADTCTAAACSYDLGQKDAAGTPSDGNSLFTFGIRKSF